MRVVTLPNGKEVSLKRLVPQGQSRIKRGGPFAFRNKYKRANEKQHIMEGLDEYNTSK